MQSHTHKADSKLLQKSQKELSDYFSEFERNVLKRNEIAKRQKKLEGEKLAQIYYEKEGRLIKNTEI